MCHLLGNQWAQVFYWNFLAMPGDDTNRDRMMLEQLAESMGDGIWGPRVIMIDQDPK